MKLGFFVWSRTCFLEYLVKFLHLRVLIIVKQKLKAISQHLANQFFMGLVFLKQGIFIVCHQNMESTQNFNLQIKFSQNLGNLAESTASTYIFVKYRIHKCKNLVNILSCPLFPKSKKPLN